MHPDHDHLFGLDEVTKGERRTLAVTLLTLVFMVVEVAAGWAYGSMALLADGLHMASHAMALGIAVAAYRFARRFAHDPRFSFGTGKVNALGGFIGALLLLAFAFAMAAESVHRFLEPRVISFDRAILVAVVGFGVNAVSAVMLHGGGAGGHGHSHDHDHDHGPGHHPGHGHGEDHNLRSAYLHVIADAVTSIAAIVALLAGKFWGQDWMDPAMGIVGSLLILRWSVLLLRQTSHVLLDRQAKAEDLAALRAALEAHAETAVSDLHVWTIAPGVRCLAATVTAAPGTDPAELHALLPPDLRIGHATIEVRTPPAPCHRP